MWIRKGGRKVEPSFENAPDRRTQTKGELKLILNSKQPNIAGVVVAGGPPGGGRRRSHREGEVARPPARCADTPLSRKRETETYRLLRMPPPRREEDGEGC